jgi:hypothetical protein
VPRGNLGGASLVRKHDDVADAIKVKVSTLDDVLAREGVSKVAVMKIDVEGFEHEVLNGARKVLGDLRPTILFESNEGGGSAVTPVMKLLRDHGYAFLAIPRCIVRMKTNLYDLDGSVAPGSHDFVAAPKGPAFERVCGALRAT